jgi:dynein heavy chain
VQWLGWMHGMPPFVIPPETPFADILVPTLDTTRSAFLLELLLINNNTVICIGPTGTGKTLSIADKLIQHMPKDFIPEFFTFSAKTSANQTQDLIDGKLDKR